MHCDDCGKPFTVNAADAKHVTCGGCGSTVCGNCQLVKDGKRLCHPCSGRPKPPQATPPRRAGGKK